MADIFSVLTNFTSLKKRKVVDEAVQNKDALQEREEMAEKHKQKIAQYNDLLQKLNEKMENQSNDEKATAFYQKKKQIINQKLEMLVIVLTSIKT